jgi:hypothetical protein
MSEKTGGPAFPTNGGVTYKGMTLLDHFAGQALALMKQPTSDTVEQVAFWAYETAAAMIAEREKRK